MEMDSEISTTEELEELLEEEEMLNKLQTKKRVLEAQREVEKIKLIYIIAVQMIFDRSVPHGGPGKSNYNRE